MSEESSAVESKQLGVEHMTESVWLGSRSVSSRNNAQLRLSAAVLVPPEYMGRSVAELQLDFGQLLSNCILANADSCMQI